VLFELDPSQKPQLDRAERGYTPMELELLYHGSITSVLLYIADPVHTDSHLRPYTWHKDLVTAGARERNLPNGYLSALEAVPTTADPSPRREAKNRLLLNDPVRRDT
jgi:hypothetical protein